MTAQAIIAPSLTDTQRAVLHLLPERFRKNPITIAKEWFTHDAKDKSILIAFKNTRDAAAAAEALHRAGVIDLAQANSTFFAAGHEAKPGIAKTVSGEGDLFPQSSFGIACLVNGEAVLSLTPQYFTKAELENLFAPSPNKFPTPARDTARDLDIVKMVYPEEQQQLFQKWANTVAKAEMKLGAIDSALFGPHVDTLIRREEGKRDTFLLQITTHPHFSIQFKDILKKYLPENFPILEDHHRHTVTFFLDTLALNRDMMDNPRSAIDSTPIAKICDSVRAYEQAQSRGK